MATTRIIAMHVNKGKTLATCLKERTDYAKNPVKTDGGNFISSYMCDPDFVDEQFLLSKKIYEQKTGRHQKNEVIAYQVRQAFKPGEITPELANKLGYELAEKITKGNNAFFVSTHVDKEHIHNHIIWNSTNLKCDRKYRDFFRSGRAIAKMNDLICLQNGLSIIENPQRKSKHYGAWLGEKKPPTKSDGIRESIDNVLLEKPKDFDEFLSKMSSFGYEIKMGKYIAFKGPTQKKFIRLRSLGEWYSEEKIRDIIAGKEKHVYIDKSNKSNEKVNILIDVQAKLKDGKSAGYERWAKTFNIKQMAKTINYLTEKKLLNYDDLKAKADKISSEFSAISKEIKDAEKRMSEISTLQKYIIQFANTKSVYDDYKKLGYSSDFKEKNIEKILLHQAAKNHFKELKLEKLPKMNDLKIEYANRLTSKKKAYVRYNDLRTEMQDVFNAKRNVECILEIDKNAEKQERKVSEKAL